MPKKESEKWHKALRMRMEGKSISAIARKLKVGRLTVSKWEKGWTDKKGVRHKGWKTELERAWKEKEEDELKFGLLLKEERLKTYDKLARLAVKKIQEQFPKIMAKTPADIKALLSEFRELCKLIAIEKGEYSVSGTPVVEVKTDITLAELQERYRKAHSDQ